MFCLLQILRPVSVSLATKFWESNMKAIRDYGCYILQKMDYWSGLNHLLQFFSKWWNTDDQEECFVSVILDIFHT